MNISLNWLKQYIALDALSIADITKKLTMSGIEVEGIESTVAIPEGVVTAKILERAKHPNADALSVCKVTDGKETFQIVCGAPNCDADCIVPLATLGTTLTAPDGSTFTIKPAKLRGEESQGMMCSSRELGLGDDHNGLMILPSDTPLGISVASLLDADTIFELEITSNRPDWLSHWGIARDLSAVLDAKTVFPKIEIPKVDTPPPADIVTVEATDLCQRYTARVIRGVTVKESPEWLQKRLTAIGLRPINNIVDITNFVLHELGQPLHAFDLNTLSGGRIVVRRAKENEPFVTLDDKEVALQPRHLVICDDTKALCLGGIMGGLNSGITETTTDVLLESALFLPSNVRATSKELGISSDSSYRFERGCDYEMVQTASDRAVQLILELAGGTLEYAMADVNQGAPERGSFELNFARINALLGVDVPAETQMKILAALGAKIVDATAEKCTVHAPSWRYDLYREADAAEEIIRIYGLDKLPFISAAAVQGGVLRDDTLYPKQVAREQLIALGLYECYTYSMVEEKTALADPTFTKENVIEISNPLNLDMACMRTSLFPQMIQNVARNISRGNPDLRLFELGRAYCKNSKAFAEEREEIVIALTGLRMPGMHSEDRRQIMDFYDLKGVVEGFFELRKLVPQCRPCTDARFVNGTAAEIIVRGKTVGFMGEVAPAFTRGMRLRRPLFMAVLQLQPIIGNQAATPQLATPSVFPSVTRDVAFIAEESLNHRDVLTVIGKLNIANLESVQLFDIFRDPATIGEGKKSMAYALTFRHSERTLTDDEINQASEKIRAALGKSLSVELR